MSVSMVVHYSQSVEDRLGKVHIPSFMLNHIHNPENIPEREDSDDSEEDSETDETPKKSTRKTQNKKRGRSPPGIPDFEAPKGLSHLSPVERWALRHHLAEVRRQKALFLLLVFTRLPPRLPPLYRKMRTPLE